MFGKLMKYDLRSMLRVFLPLWLLTPILSLLLSFSIRGSYRSDNGSVQIGTNILVTLMGVLFAGVIVALLVVTVVLVVQRFWNGLLKDEGYLMFTLPVEPWQLIASKGLSATLVSFISGAVGVLSCSLLVLGSSDDVILEFLQIWNSVLRFWNLNFRISLGVIGALAVVLMIAATAENIWKAYASMALGQLWQGHRVAGSILAYLGCSVVTSLVSNLFSGILMNLLPDNLLEWINAGADEFVVVYLLLMILAELILLLIYCLITERVLSKRLNLE